MSQTRKAQLRPSPGSADVCENHGADSYVNLQGPALGLLRNHAIADTCVQGNSGTSLCPNTPS